MRISDMNWMQVEDYLKGDDRCILPLGSTEQHAYLSLSVDSILSERVSLEASDPLAIPVFPVVAYGITPYFRAYPGTISLRIETYLRLVRDILDGMAEAGFRRIMIVNGHGGNIPASSLVREWMADHPNIVVKFHNWWNAPKTWAKVQAIDPIASHASWMENFPWTRLVGVELPDYRKPMVDLGLLNILDPRGLRSYLDEGNFGGRFQRSDEDMLTIWQAAVGETREMLAAGWGVA